MSTPQLLLLAYQKASGLEVSLSPSRQMSLTQLVQCGMEPEDVTAVIGELKRLMKLKPDIYSPACLEFRNSMADSDRFEERALTLRQRAKRLQPPRPQVATQHGAFTVLREAPEKQPERVDPAVIADQFLSLSQEFGKRRLA